MKGLLDRTLSELQGQVMREGKKGQRARWRGQHRQGPTGRDVQDCLGTHEEAHLSRTEGVSITLGKPRARPVC